MNKKNLFIIALLSLFLIFVFNFVQDRIFSKHNVNVPISELKETCTPFNKECVSPIMLNTKKQVKDSGENFITLDIREHVTVIKSLQILSLALLAVIFILIVSKNRKENKEDDDISFPVLCLLGLASIYKIFYLYTNNIMDIPFLLAASVIIACLCLYFIIFGLMKLITKNNSDSAIIAIFLMLVLYHIKIFISNYPSFNIYKIIGIVLMFMICVVSINSKKFIPFLKPFTAALIILCIVNGAGKILSKTDFAFFNRTHAPQEFKLTKNPERDIYIILLDMYAGSDTLKYLGYDNSAFINTLKQNHFMVFDNINSNYNKTLASISSVLNFDYIDPLSFNTPSDAISEAAIFKMAEQLGYNTYYLNSWPLELYINNKIIEHVYNSDFYVGQTTLSLFFTNTLFEPIIDIFNDTNPIENALEYMNLVLNEKRNKKLFFAHFLMPHWPYLYDENGQKLTERDEIYVSDFKFKINTKSYLEFLKYANVKTLELVNRLLNTTEDKKPVIIIFGDHGIRTTFYTADEKSHMQELKRDRWFLKGHFNTFLAYYNPDMDTQYYQDTHSLVNFFRKFSNEVFGTDFKPLPDKKFYIYYDTSPKQLHKMQGEVVK